MLGVSNESLDSPACQAEFTYARSLGRAVLPVLIADDVTFSALPRDLAVLQLVDYRRDDKKALMSLARSLLHLEPRKPLPDELPPEPSVPLSYLGELREHVDAKSLDFDRQSALLVRFRELLRGSKAGEVAELVVKFRRRHDVYAIVAEELDGLLASTGKQGPAAKPGADLATPPAPAPAKVPAGRPAPVPLASLYGRTYAALSQSYRDEQLMSTLGITYDGARYQYLSYSFAILSVAVDYAVRRISPKDKPLTS
jgi:hypothetical protein